MSELIGYARDEAYCPVCGRLQMLPLRGIDETQAEYMKRNAVAHTTTCNDGNNSDCKAVFWVVYFRPMGAR